MAEEQRLYEENKKKSSYRKILDGIQKMSLLTSDSNQQMNATASTKGFAKPYKTSQLLAQTVYDDGVKMRGADSNKNASTSFKIRSMRQYKPNITEMKNNASRSDQVYQLTDRTQNKTEVGPSSSK